MLVCDAVFTKRASFAPFSLKRAQNGWKLTPDVNRVPKERRKALVCPFLIESMTKNHFEPSQNEIAELCAVPRHFANKIAESCACFCEKSQKNVAQNGAILSGFRYTEGLDIHL